MRRKYEAEVSSGRRKQRAASSQKMPATTIHGSQITHHIDYYSRREMINSGRVGMVGVHQEAGPSNCSPSMYSVTRVPAPTSHYAPSHSVLSAHSSALPLNELSPCSQETFTHVSLSVICPIMI